MTNIKYLLLLEKWHDRSPENFFEMDVSLRERASEKIASLSDENVSEHYPDPNRILKFNMLEKRQTLVSEEYKKLFEEQLLMFKNSLSRDEIQHINDAAASRKDTMQLRGKISTKLSDSADEWFATREGTMQDVCMWLKWESDEVAL